MLFGYVRVSTQIRSYIWKNTPAGPTNPGQCPYQNVGGTAWVGGANDAAGATHAKEVE